MDLARGKFKSLSHKRERGGEKDSSGEKLLCLNPRNSPLQRDNKCSNCSHTSLPLITISAVLGP